MRPVKKKEHHHLYAWLSAGCCILCFLAGFSIPILISKKDTDGFEKAENVYTILKNEWYFGKDVDDLDSLLSEQAILGMTTLEADPHTNYFSLEEAQAFSQTLAGSNVGVGILFYVNEQGQFVVRDVYINSTADKAGLQKGDVIVKAGEMTVSENSSEDVVQLIRNHDGQKLKLEIERNGEIMTVIVEPGSYDMTVSMDTDGNTGIITVSSFSELTGEDFHAAVQRLKNAGIENLIIDLRDNTGGLMDAAVDVADSLLDEGTVVHQRQFRSGSVVQDKTTGKYETAEFDQIIILENQNTASASEILIGALKDNLDNVTLMGTTSYGKGTVQTSIPFSDGTSMKYTVAEWLTPDGTSINGTGFKPDVEVQADPIRSAQYRPLEEEEIIVPDQVHDNAGALQTFLQYLGYSVDRTDNYFSAASGESVRQFQLDNGLEATGTVDQTTWDTLVNVTSRKLMENSEAEDIQRIKAFELAGAGK